MREKINKLAKGIIDDSTPLICVEPNSIEYDLTPGEAVRFCVQISSKNDVYIKGLAYSSDARVKIANPSFGGPVVNLNIDVLLRTTDDDEDISGTIDLVTNGGEFEIPFLFHKKHIQDEDILQTLNTIDDFASIVSSDNNKAFKIFENKNFINASFMDDLSKKQLYNVLKKNPDRRIAFEQFLIGVGILNSTEAKFYEEKTIDSFVNERKNYFKKKYYEYSRIRLSYEMDRGNTLDEIALMSEALDKISDYSKKEEWITLLKAEVCYLKRDTQNAALLMNSVRETILADRQEYLMEYFLLEYLDIVVLKRIDKKASFIRLCRKFIEEEKMHELFFYVLKLDDDLMQDDNKLHQFLNDVFNIGSRSPYLYYYNCTLLNDHPEYLYNAKPIDNQTLNFGAKYKLLNDSIHNSVVSASCISFIKTDKKSVSCHKFYSEGIELQLSINGLFEYYLYSLPKDGNYKIIDEVLDHYANGDTLDLNTKIRLYSNVVKFKNKNSNIYKAYEDRITDFALNQLNNNNINPYLADIYSAVIKPNMITNDNAEAMFTVSCAHHIVCEDAKFKSVVIAYPLTTAEYNYKIYSGKATVAIFDSNVLIFMQDAYGNRYIDGKYTIQEFFEQNTLKNASIKAGTNNNLIVQIRIKELINKKNINIDDVQILESAVHNPQVNEIAKAVIVDKLISYYNQHTASGYNPDFLLRINKNDLNVNERQDLTNAYISCGCYNEAYEMIQDFGYSGVSYKNIKLMCSKLILDDLYTKDKLLINLAELTVEQHASDNIIIDYLCEHYNGPSEKMFNIMKKAIESQCNTYDMEERLLAQELFINDKSHIDQVFEWYASRKKTNDSIVKAYFTLKTAEYFIDESKINPRIIEYLEKSVTNVENLSNIPVIYMLALSRYYSRESNLSSTQIELSKKFIYFLCENKLIFPYFKRFANRFQLPVSIINSKIVVYKCTPGSKPLFESQILPCEEEKSIETEINRFMNLYIYSKDLFSGEQWKYEIYEFENDEKVLINSGIINANENVSYGNNLMFDLINEICKLSNEGKDSEAVSKIDDYILMKDSAKTLFSN